MKQGARYLRFSRDKQSVHSIERQDMVTEQWMKYNKINIVDTFIDRGHSAKNFDRPDLKMLMEFIKKNYRSIDYLVVSELTRFSRDLGGAVSLVKKIQFTYGIKIVSAGRSSIYDCSDSNSYFMMSLEFLMGDAENIKRENDINGGIYTAKATKGRYIHGQPPIGYIREGLGEHSRLLIDEEKAIWIKEIYSQYLNNVPYYLIAANVKKMGFPYGSHMMIQKVLDNPIYSGQQYVKPWREHPGGLFPALHQPIIDVITWNQVQEKRRAKPRPKVSIADEMPLRGVLHCHCNQLLTGAPSRNKMGNYYYYYKCKHPQHNNISVIKAHEKLDQMLGHMSLTDRLVEAIKENCEKQFTERMKENKKLLQKKQAELEIIHDRLSSLEEKYISNKIEFETYTKWFSDLTQNRSITRLQIENLKRDDNELYMLLQNNIEQFTDLRFLYRNLETVDKQEFLRRVFDNKLYWKDDHYRTPYMIPAFTHNLLILKQKQLLELDERKGIFEEIPRGGAQGPIIEPLTNLLSFLHSVQVA